MSSANQPRRVHPASMLIGILRYLPGLLVLIVVARPEGRAVPSWLSLAALGLLIALAAWSFLQWRFLTFYFDEDGDLRVDSGVLYRRQQRIALSRLQSVDIAQPLLSRILGMASVRVEVAGSDSGADIEYLPLSQAEELREQILARAAGLPDSVPAPPEAVLHQVPVDRLITSLLLSGSTVVAFLVSLGGVAALLAVTGLLGAPLALLGLLAPLASIWNEFSAYFNFIVTSSADGLRVRAGLVHTATQTVPPGRVHAIEITQPLLWRRKDWVRVSMNLAATDTSGDENRLAAPRVLVPVATRQEALQLIGALLPQWRLVDREFAPVPHRAARRAWLQHPQLGVDHDDRLLVVRRGRLVRRVAAVAHEHVQSVRVMQGPWQRALGLATMRADIVPGPVAVLALHRDAEDARRLAEQEIAAMRAARRSAGPERWRAQPPPAEPTAYPPPTFPPPAWPPMEGQ